MSNAILRTQKPVGTIVTDGSFENYSVQASQTSGRWSKQLIGGAGSVAIVTTGAPEIPDETHYLKMISGSSGKHTECRQQLAIISGMVGKEVTFAGWAWSKIPGSYTYIDTDAGRLATGAVAPGMETWEEIRVTATIPSGATTVVVGIAWDPGQNSKSAYYDSFSVVAGDTHIRVELTEGYIFPYDLPENYLVSTGMTADGLLFVNDNGVTVPQIRLKLEGIPEDQYQAVRNFYRYVANGPTQEIEYIDIDEAEYACRMLTDSLADAAEIGPGLYNCSITLRIRDEKGIE